MKLIDLFENDAPYSGDTIWYHGSKWGGVVKFDHRYIGTGVVGSNSSNGFYFSTSREAAKFFADEDYIERESEEDWEYDDVQVYGEDGEFYLLINDINTGPYQSWDEAEDAGKNVVDRHNAASIGDVVHHDEKVGAYHLKIRRPKITHSVAEFRSAEKTAKDDGYDAVIGVDVHDGDMVSTVAVVFNPNSITPIN